MSDFDPANRLRELDRRTTWLTVANLLLCGSAVLWLVLTGH